MRDSVLVRLTAIAGIVASTFVFAQQPATSSLPSTSTTSAATTLAVPSTPAQLPSRRADISYVNNELVVAASNSSLNQILREISRLTGIKITGGINEERVFGKYGPGPASEVLRSLLDGSNSNMLFVQATGEKSSELILTPRMGGPSPPNPNASHLDDNRDDEQPALPFQPSESQSTPAPQNATPQPISPPPAGNGAGANTNSSSDPNQQQSPNGVKTPQQIYEELQRLRQQQQQSKPQ